MGRIFKRFMDDCSGNFSIALAVSTMVILLGIGVAVDMSSLSASKSRLQNAVDNAVLAASAAEGSKGQKKKIGKKAFYANQDPNLSEDPDFTIDIDNDGMVTATGSLDHEYNIMSIFGYGPQKISALAEAGTKSLSKTEVVLVLDYSSSMNDQYEEMADAAIDLVDELTNNGVRTDVKIGLVPFARQVYFSMDGQYIDGGTSGVTWTNCSTDRGWPFVVTDATPTVSANSQWGLLEDDESDGDFDYCDEYATNQLVVRPLTTAHAGTKAQLSAMEPYSGTNLAMGMQIGWQVISPNAPWTEGASYSDPSWKKYIVVLGDGAHGIEGSGPGGTLSTSQGRQNFDQSCTNAKAQDITVITIAYDIEETGARERLQDCATSAVHYFEGDSSSIDTVFAAIGEFIGHGDVRLMR